MRTRAAIARILDSQGGVLLRRDHPELAGGLDRLTRDGSLVALLPGAYVDPRLQLRPEVRMRVALLRHPDAVLVGAAAARLSFWPSAPVPTVEVAVPRPVAPASGFSFTRRRIPAELIVHRAGWRLAAPALTALDLATWECADSIDLALRTRVVTLAMLQEAVAATPNRAGNRLRRQLLLDSCATPWSAAERRAHRLLREAGIDGWKGNHPVVLGQTLYWLDIAFVSARLAIEIDGRLHEDDTDLFESDRWRQNALVTSGWRVIRFTWTMLRDQPDVVIATIRRALR